MPLVDVNGAKIYYEERGDRGGEPLVLVSGIGMQIVQWPDALLDAIAARGIRLITFDNREVGASTRHDHFGVPPVRKLLGRALAGLRVDAPYTLFDMANDVAWLLQALDVPRAHVAGVSMGGMIAQATAIAHSGRVKSLISLMSHSGGRVLTGRLRATLKLLRPAPKTREQAIANQLDFFRTAGSTKFHRDDDALAERAGRSWDRGIHPPGFARQFAAVLATGDMRPRLKYVRAPTLVVHGTSDGIFDVECGRATAEAIPGARLQVIDGWGHDLAEGVFPTLVEAIAGHVAANA